MAATKCYRNMATFAVLAIGLMAVALISSVAAKPRGAAIRGDSDVDAGASVVACDKCDAVPHGRRQGGRPPTTAAPDAAVISRKRRAADKTEYQTPSLTQTTGNAPLKKDDKKTPTPQSASAQRNKRDDDDEEVPDEVTLTAILVAQF